MKEGMLPSAGRRRVRLVAGAAQHWCDRGVPCCDSIVVLIAMSAVMRKTSEGWTTSASPPMDALTGRVATSQGVVTRGQLLALGLGATTIARRVENGRLHRVHKGVYAVGHLVLGARGRWMAAVLTCGPDAALSHDSAAPVWQIRASDAKRSHVTVPGTGGRQRTGLHVHR
jgi:Transcriptional regulator, AbiEi antitoxin